MDRQKSRRLRRKVEAMERDLSRYVRWLDTMMVIDPFLGMRLATHVAARHKLKKQGYTENIRQTWARIQFELAEESRLVAEGQQ